MPHHPRLQANVASVDTYDNPDIYVKNERDLKCVCYYN